MQFLKKRPWRSTKREAHINGSTQPLPTETITSSATWYRNIHELPFWCFRECQLNGTLNLLVKSGLPDSETLAAAWDVILGQYHEAIGDTATIRRLIIYKDISLLTINLKEVYECVIALRRRYHSFFHDKLNALLECNIDLDPNDPMSYMKNLSRYLKRSASIKRNLELKKIEYHAIKEGAVGAKATRAYYDDVLITLSDHAKYEITENITVYVYCERFRRLTAHIKAQKKAK